MSLAVLIVALLAFPAHAADYTVNATHDDGDGSCNVAECTLREAVAQATSLDKVILPAGTYQLGAVDLELAGDTIVGAGARTTSIVGGGFDRVIRVFAGVNQISGVTIRGGRSPQGPGAGSGGGILVAGIDGQNVSLTLSEATVRDNQAGEGGGIANFSTLTVVRSTVTDNHVSEATGPVEGGGIASGGTTTVRNSTISANTARSGESSGTGAGVLVTGGTFLAASSTIAANVPITGDTLAFAGAIAADQSATVTLSHTIVSSVGEPAPCIVSGGLQGSRNIVDDSSCGTAVGNPLLGPLRNNGGPTDTHAIPANSPAVNAGISCEATDQRGFARVGACDVGAYEYDGATPPPQSGPPPPPPPPPPPGGGDDLPPPVAGKNLNVLPKRGTVKIKLPGRQRFRTLADGEQLPVGTIVDTLKGRVTLVAAGGQTSDFYGGIFRIGQGKGAKPLTTLTLVEKLACGKRGIASAAAKKKKKKRRLWGDGRGRFRTKGEYSSATVRGTKWLVEDKCTSTLTRVTKGRVAVRDFVKRKTVIVRAGKRYVAKRRR